MSGDTMQLRRLFRVVNGGTPSPDPENWGAAVTWVTPDDLGKSKGVRINGSARTLTEQGLRAAASLVPSGSIVLSTRAPIGHVGIADRPLAFNQGCKALVPRQALDERFFYYQLIAKRRELQAAGQGATFTELSATALGSIRLICPPPDEQRLVADFLDAEVARLDRLRDSRTRAIELLGERINAIRAFLVLGEDQSNLKGTGIPGLPRVPAGWVAGPLRRFDAHVQTGPFGSLLHASDYVSGGIPVVNPANLQGERIVPDERVTVDEATRKRLARYSLRPGDVVFARRGELGRAALVTEPENGWLCGTGCLRVRLRGSSLSSRFLSLYLNLDVIRQYFESFSVGSTLDNLNSELLLSAPVSVPPRQDQERIVGEVEREAASYKQLVGLMRRHANLITERRNALISAAVTGQLEPDSFRACALTT